MTKEIILNRIDSILSLAVSAKTQTWSSMTTIYVQPEPFHEFRAAALSFIGNALGKEHSFYKEFDSTTGDTKLSCLNAGQGILKAFKNEVEEGWLFAFKGLVSAEIFTDFLDMANHLLKEGFKDPAAVMIGGVLEEHLRQLCTANTIEVTYLKDGKDLPKTADRMNNELASKDVYGKLYQKSVTSWLDLRNKAAHGHYTEYDSRQVELMEAGVLDFIAKTNVV